MQRALIGHMRCGKTARWAVQSILWPQYLAILPKERFIAMKLIGDSSRSALLPLNNDSLKPIHLDGTSTHDGQNR
jgi:hypothetical protein